MQIKSNVFAPKEGASTRWKGINIKTDEVVWVEEILKRAFRKVNGHSIDRSYCRTELNTKNVSIQEKMSLRTLLHIY